MDKFVKRFYPYPSPLLELRLLEIFIETWHLLLIFKHFSVFSQDHIWCNFLVYHCINRYYYKYYFKINKIFFLLGLGGGYNERENVEYIEREESDGEYDEVFC